MAARRAWTTAHVRLDGAYRPHRARLVAASFIAAALSGCSGAKADTSELRRTRSETTSVAALAATSPSRPGVVEVFFVKGEQFAKRDRPMLPGQDAATVAVRHLLAGPTAAERAAGVDTTIPKKTNLISLHRKDGTATVKLRGAHTTATAFDLSLRPARAAQFVYTLTAIPKIKQVLISVNGVHRATFIGSKLAVKGALDKHDLSKPITLPKKPNLVPKGPAPADPRGVQRRLASLNYLPGNAVTGAWNERTRHAVIAFQAWHRLDRDGIVGAHTLAALESASHPKQLRTHSRPPR